MYCTSAEILNLSFVYWKIVIQMIFIVLQLQEKVSKAPVLLTRSWVALSTANKWQRPQESVSGSSALETLPHCFARSAEFPSPLQWHNLTGPSHALGVSLTFLGPEGRWLCDNLGCYYCKRNFYSFFFLFLSSAQKCSLRASPRSFF